MRGDVRQWIQGAGLGRVVDHVESLLRPSIRVRTWEPQGLGGDGNTIEVGASKLGGLPDLPHGWEWPRWRGRPEYREANAANPEPRPEKYWDRYDGRDGPMCFLGQFRLADVAPLDVEGALPPTGMLYVFCALWVDALGESEEDRGAWRVIYHDGAPSDLRRTPPPADASPPLGCRPVAFFEELTLPDSTMSPEYENLGLNPDEHVRYCLPLMEQMRANPRKHNPIHRLLGWPQPWQGDMRGRLCPSEHGDWRLLLQIDSDYQQDLFWQSLGCGYFWIRRADLLARNFDGAWLVSQHESATD